jgi:uncharacterized membrane protein HdeD (DUF308 family)
MSVDSVHPSVAFPPKGARAWLVVEGLLLIVLGGLAAVAPVLAGLAAAVVLGWLLVLSGFLGLIGLFGSRGHDHPLWRLISAMVAIGAGGLVLWTPLAGAIGLALLIAAYLALNGITALAMAAHHRGRVARGWGWMVFTGLIGLGLSVVIAIMRPTGDAALIGYVIAIDFIVGGVALLGVGAAVRPASAVVSV